jgi:hypothetical protein
VIAALRVAGWLGVLGLLPAAATAQGYQVRLDTRWQAAAYRGVQLDSIAAADTVSQPGSGPLSPDGFAVRCRPDGSYCTFFRPGATVRAAPLTTTATITAWGVGLPGLSVHAVGRAGLDLGDANAWPGTEPAAQLLAGYAEYGAPRWTARLGRQDVASRLGSIAFDGAALVARDARRGLELRGYAGWGLSRGVALPVTSPALNPLDEFQPQRRQLVAGASAGWRAAPVDVRVDYLREVDPRSHYFVSERVGLQSALRPVPGLTVAAGADYDLASGWWGSAEASLAYTFRAVYARFAARRYRPHFELWTVWGAFSPVPYRAADALLTVTATSRVQLRARYERYAFEAAEANTPLLGVEQDGWRWEVGGTVTPAVGWTLDGSYRREFGPGAAAATAAASLTYAPSRRLSVTALASGVDRPLEFRFNEAVVRSFGVDAALEATDRIQVGLNLMRYDESHRRPDAGAFDWDQFRAAARVVLLLGGADGARLPAPIRLLPGDRAAR